MALNIVIGWSMLNSRDMDFKKDFVDMVLSIDGLDTDKKHVKFLMTMDGINRTVNRGGADILIIHETINTVNIGIGTIESYLSKAPDMRIILIVPDDKRSSGKLKGLFETGFYDCLYESELDGGHIEDLIFDPRGEAEAYDYYGLEDYESPLDRKGERTKPSGSSEEDEDEQEGQDTEEEAESEEYESAFFDEVIVDKPQKKAPAVAKKKRPVSGEDMSEEASIKAKRADKVKGTKDNIGGQTDSDDKGLNMASSRSTELDSHHADRKTVKLVAGRNTKDNEEQQEKDSASHSREQKAGKAEKTSERPATARQKDTETSSSRETERPDETVSGAKSGRARKKGSRQSENTENAMFSGALNSAELPEWDAELRKEQEREERVQKQKDIEDALFRETKKLQEEGYFDELPDDKVTGGTAASEEVHLTPSEVSRLGTNDPYDHGDYTAEEQELAALKKVVGEGPSSTEEQSYARESENEYEGKNDFSEAETAEESLSDKAVSHKNASGKEKKKKKGHNVQTEDGLTQKTDGEKNQGIVKRQEEKHQNGPLQRTVAGEALSVPLTVPEETGDSPFFSMSDSEIASYLSSKQNEAKQPKLIKVPDEPFSDIAEQVLMHYIKEETTALANFERGITTEEDFQREVSLYIAKTFDLTPEGRRIVYKSFYSFMFEYDEIESLIEDENVSDIKTYDQDNIRFKENGERKQAMVKFRSFDHYTAFLSHLARRNHRSITGGNALVKFMDTKSSDVAKLRVNISTEFINSSGSPFMHIRKTPKKKYTTEELIDKGMFSPRTAAFLINCAQNDSGIVFTGKGSAGKTTLMNWLIDYIPRNKSGLCIQESDELYSDTHPDILFQNIEKDEAQVQDGENAKTKDYDLKTLAQNGLLIDIDYFIIGEIKDAEAKYFLNAAYTGNRCWASVHSPSSQAALPRIADLAKYDTDYSKSELLKMLQSLHTIVFMKDFRVAEISQIIGWNDEKDLMEYRRIPIL